MNNKKPVYQLRKIDYGIIAFFFVLFIWATFWFTSQWSQKHTQSITQSTEENITTTAKKISLPTLSHSEKLVFQNIEKENPVYSNIWGEENITQDDSHIHTFFPKGSYKPSATPRGGAGFIYNADKIQGKDRVILSYDLAFADNFEFVKGGKLPGLCWGDCPRGWSGTDKGFSTRFMWRKNGDLEIYGYLPNKASTMGQSLWRGMFQFQTNTTYNIAQEIILNTPGKEDGVLRVYVDEIMVYENPNITFRRSKDISTDKIIFSTFFGGGDDSWATPVDTSISFSDFKLRWN